LPGPGEKDSAQSEGNFNFDAIVIFLIFSLSFLKSYSPGPGLWVWLNIETDLQSSLPCPMVIPCLGLAWNSEESEYLSGDGDCLLLNENRITEQYPLYLHIRRMGLVCLAWSSFHRNESWMRWDIPCLVRKVRKATAFWKAEHCLRFGTVQRWFIGMI
jgi:hypothetical protein